MAFECDVNGLLRDNFTEIKCENIFASRKFFSALMCSQGTRYRFHIFTRE